MSLFDIHKMVDAEKTNTTAYAMPVEGSIRLVNESISKNLSDAIGTIKMNEHVLFFTKNSWTVPDLVLHILNETGSANVFIASWAMKEMPARKLIKAKQMGLINELHLKLDHRVKTYDNAVYHQLVKNADSLTLAHCHAKVTVIENANWGVVICGSANYSTNPRAEAGMIICHKSAAEYSKNWILNF